MLMEFFLAVTSSEGLVAVMAGNMRLSRTTLEALTLLLAFLASQGGMLHLHLSYIHVGISGGTNV